MKCLLIDYPNLFLQALNGDNNLILDEGQYLPLNLGEPETGLLTEANLLYISRRIGQEWEEIGFNLGLTYPEMDRIKYNNRSVLGQSKVPECRVPYF